MLEYLKIIYGTNPSNTIHLLPTAAQPLTQAYIKSKLNGKQGIFVIIPKVAYGPNSFNATGHVDLLNTDGSFMDHDYTDPTGGTKEVYLFILK